MTTRMDHLTLLFPLAPWLGLALLLQSLRWCECQDFHLLPWCILRQMDLVSTLNTTSTFSEVVFNVNVNVIFLTRAGLPSNLLSLSPSPPPPVSFWEKFLDRSSKSCHDLVSGLARWQCLYFVVNSFRHAQVFDWQNFFECNCFLSSDLKRRLAREYGRF